MCRIWFSRTCNKVIRLVNYYTYIWRLLGKPVLLFLWKIVRIFPHILKINMYFLWSWLLSPHFKQFTFWKDMTVFEQVNKITWQIKMLRNSISDFQTWYYHLRSYSCRTSHMFKSFLLSNVYGTFKRSLIAIV